MSKASVQDVGIAAAMGGGAVLLASMFGRFTPMAGIYHAVIYAVFFTLYTMIPGGFAANFQTPGKSVSSGDVAFFTAVTHTTIGYGDMYPKTSTARRLVLLHMVLVFVATASIIPIGGSSSSGGGGFGMGGGY